MKKTLFLVIVALLFIFESEAQLNRYVVRFRHKGPTSFSLSNPLPYLSQRAIDRRTRYGIAIDSTDLPVPAVFISQIESVPNVTLLNVSKWLNAVTIRTTDANAVSSIMAFPFVESITGIAARPSSRPVNKLEEEILPLKDETSGNRQTGTNNYFDYGTGSSFDEIHLHRGELLHNIGLRGQGMQIAVLDGGFYHYTTLKAFDSANLNGQFLTTWDFVNREESVVEDNSHGMSCLSTIAANIPGQFIGKAPKASFHLFKTEDVSSEYPIEEFNWACAAERADSTGADIITSSLGYGYDFGSPVPDYPYSDLNGDITMSAQAADLAAKKGLLVFNAAGNSGTDSWHMITTPADGDSVVAVGAVNTDSVVGAFSSYGPSADGRIKPDVASVGVSAVIQTSGNTIGASNGTSFACPNMAGMSACLWQGFPEFSNMRIVRAIREAGSKFTTPDDRVGYGIPDMKKAFTTLLIEFANSSATVNNCDVTLNWTSKDIGEMKYEIERKTAADPDYIKIGETAPLPGSVLANHSYQFQNTLINVNAGTVSYRIRQIIDTSASGFTAAYIDTTDFTITAACTPTATNDPNSSTDKIWISPNPVHNGSSLFIKTTNAIPEMIVAIYNIRGQLITRMYKSKGPGQTNFDLPTQKLAAGKYLIRVYQGNRQIGATELLKL